jgi:uncharacterized protein YfkK (UPF0435 family)
MSSYWYHQGRAARLLSSDIFVREDLKEFGTLIKKYHETIGIDRRKAAMDWEVVRFESLAEISDEYYEAFWHQSCLVDSIFHSAAKEDCEVLSNLMYMADYDLQQIAAKKMKLTMVNNSYLNNFEKFLFSTHLGERFGSISYDVIDQQDIFNGFFEKTFDIVTLMSHDVMGLGLKEISAYLQRVKIGGILIVSTVSQFRSLYSDSTKINNFKITDINRFIKDREDFRTMHLPDAQGILVAQRIS